MDSMEKQPSLLGALSARDIAWVLVSIVLGFTVLALSNIIYNLYFHPLAKYPGPAYACATSLSYWAIALTGDVVPWIQSIHTQHGPAVRIGPDKLSYISAEAWRDIYAPASGARRSNPKDRTHYVEEKYGILAVRDDAAHARLRRIFAPAFADRSIRRQEPMVARYADRLVAAVRRDAEAAAGGELDLCKLWTCATFDVMGQLTFGEPLGLLDRSEYTPWVTMVFGWNKAIDLARLQLEYPLLGLLAKYLTPRSLLEMERSHAKHSSDRVDRRLELGSDEPDIWNLVPGAGEEGKGLARQDMYVNAGVFMIAGTETSATLLSGLTWMLCTNPEKIGKLCAEVRGGFQSDGEMTVERLAKLPYLNACLEEGLRLYPPLPIGPPREVAEGGNVICGEWVPGGTRLSVAQFAAYRSPLNFKDPESFVPERWLPGTGYENDKKDVLQPFSIGPRNCIGQNLAYYEMRIFLAKVLWNFDIKLCPQSKDWLNQKSFALWQKPPLWVKVAPVQ
ncbi:hypothetical protein SLS56_009533 [Neofusicoccum ribis]|uniref:Cytochrome P450 monooxygenase n=1 Tax=Neofusicoccum ribis TaxID=45134 RepID=A0ABR3SH12_9PEZI